MTIQNKKTAIIGGGPGGLTLAKLLQQGGCDVSVYERDIHKNARVQGANLDLHEESGLVALKQAGLLDDFYRNHLPEAGKVRVMDNLGVIHLDDHHTGIAEHRPEIDRGPLRKILLDSLKPETVIWDSQFVSMHKERDGWQLLFKNGTQYYADIVIGADGANSKIRPYLSPVKPVYSGVTIVEGNIDKAEVNAPGIFSLLKGGKIFAFGNEQSIIISTKGDGSIAFYTGEKVHENWVHESGIDFKNTAEVKHWFDTHFSKWGPVYHELFTSDKVSFIPRPLYHYAAGQSWKAKKDLTLIGDAAHRMPPYAGEGVNMAMLDALELSEALLNHPDTLSAISSYESHMLARAEAVTAMTINNTHAFHATNGLENIVNMFQSFHT